MPEVTLSGYTETPFEHQGMTVFPSVMHTNAGDFGLVETVEYSNGGSSGFYVQEGTAVILDHGICDPPALGSTAFEYSAITLKQNEYMSKFDRVFRFMDDETESLDSYLAESRTADNKAGVCSESSDTGMSDVGLSDSQSASFPYLQSADAVDAIRPTADRADFADATPLERHFEKHFINVYGPESADCLWKEYGVTDCMGSVRYLDYVVKTSDGDIAVEENGVTYHHPQLIGPDRYRKQLLKQNSCVAAGIKLYRFSSEDCGFTERFEDDIRTYFGQNADAFQPRGLLVDRPFKLYEHQENVLETIAQERAGGSKSFLVVLPTASGKSKVVEQDMLRFAKEKGCLRVLILVPNHAVLQDWQQHISDALVKYQDGILVCTYAYMARHFTEFEPRHFDYIVVDEAHHAVAPGLKRTIQYFDPDFLIGLTATDQRPDKKRLETVFGSYRANLSLEDAMERGIVARANVFRVETNIDLSRVRINGKEYVNADLEKSIRVTSRNELIVDVLRDYFCEGRVAERQGLVFCVSVQHAREMSRLLNDAGIPTAEYSSKCKDPAAVMSAFREKRIRFLCTCQMISEGWDYPELGILVMARPTLSKVLYLQQLGRGLRKTPTKGNVFVIDVVDEYGCAVIPCSMHSIFKNPLYVPFGDVANRNYKQGDIIEVDGLRERVERIVEVDVFSFAERYEDYLSVEQLAREYFVSTDTVSSWIRKGKVEPSASFVFGSKKVHLFSPDDAERYRQQLGLKRHTEETIHQDFFDFLAEHVYTFSYKIVFLLAFLDCMDSVGDARIDEVLGRYRAFYQRRLEEGLPVDREGCPYTEERLADDKYLRRSMLDNPFEKFERKRFMYYSKDLGVISLNHALRDQLSAQDYEAIRTQMHEDLEAYYGKLS